MTRLDSVLQTIFHVLGEAGRILYEIAFTISSFEVFLLFLFIFLLDAPLRSRRRGRRIGVLALALVEKEVRELVVEVSSVIGAGNGVILIRIHLSLEGNSLFDKRRRQMHRVLEVDVVVGSSVDQKIIDITKVFHALQVHYASPIVAGRIVGRSRHVAKNEKDECFELVLWCEIRAP